MRTLPSLAGLLVALATADAAYAGDAPPPAPVPPAPTAVVAAVADDPCCVRCARWNVTLGAWVWGVEGTVGDNGRRIDVDSDWTDTLDHLDSLEFALNGRVRVEASRWRVTAGVDGASIQDSATFREGVFTLTGELDLWTAYAQVGYVVAGGRLGCGPCAPTWCLDAYAGARFWTVSAEVDGVVGGPLGLSTSDEWLDPLVGLHLEVGGPRWLFVAEIDVGGFGIGSDLTWSALAAVGWRVSRGLAVSAGWRALDVDREDGLFVFDARLSGPMLGVTLSF